MLTANTLNRLGWSESSLGAHAILLTLSCSSSNESWDSNKQMWYISPMWAAKVQASLRIRAFLPEPPLLAHTSSESRGTFRQKARCLDPLNGWACAVKICHDGMLEDTNSLDAPHIWLKRFCSLTKSARSTLMILIRIYTVRQSVCIIRDASHLYYTISNFRVRPQKNKWLVSIFFRVDR